MAIDSHLHVVQYQGGHNLVWTTLMTRVVFELYEHNSKLESLPQCCERPTIIAGIPVDLREVDRERSS